MSIVRLLAEGAGEAVKLVPLVFTLGVVPAQAQLPRAVPAVEATQGPAPLLQPTADSPAPTLVSEHVELTISDQGSQLRTTAVFRNETSAPITARYALPLAGAVTVRGVDNEDDVVLVDDDAACGGDEDESADAAQFIEAGEADPRTTQTGIVWLEPGDEITLVSERPADVFKRDLRRRVVIALPPAPAGQRAPEFSAEIDADGALPIVAMGSATHGGDVDGLGGSYARLFIPNGRVYPARFLSVDLEMQPVAQETARRWGNEDRLPIAMR